MVNVYPDLSHIHERQLLTACWGKLAPNSNIFHPLLYHMLDVANVARLLLGGKTSSWSREVADALSTEVAGIDSWLPLWLALHDLGKLTIPFQVAVPAQAARLASTGIPLIAWPVPALAHNLYTAFLIQAVNIYLISDDMRTVLTHALGGHHGSFPHGDERRHARDDLTAFDLPFWRDLRETTVSALAEMIQATAPPLLQPDNISTAIMVLTGFTILVDWLASDETAFPPAQDVDLDSYIQLSYESARCKLETTGFMRPMHSKASTCFRSLFPELATPRPLQLAIDDVPTDIFSQPCLAIIEAPTGEGKTEAALALAHRLAGTTGTDALYYALPTTATSNQMYLRVNRYIARNLGLSSSARLIHGQAWLQQDALFTKSLEGGAGIEPIDEWYAPLKRALLAPFGVGTIDQVELAALNTRHNALRFLGLAGKVVILDEVHAYDAYMNTIIERLLQWLSTIGTSVILLSATLPTQRREALVRAYAPTAHLDATTNYPMLTIIPATTLAHDQEPYYAQPKALQPDRQIYLGKLPFDINIDNAASWLIQAVQEGGCACWITNTVQRAQELYTAVSNMAAQDIHRILLHARFPLAQRAELEHKVMERYGPDGARPERGIVIGTQVLEQSLDLDFDVMVSDIAPIDLILQRAGRLHRHVYRSRPMSHVQPWLWLPLPELGASVPDLGVHAVIYDEYILQATLRVLQGRSSLSLPADYRQLIEVVYSGRPPAMGDLLQQAWQNHQRTQSYSRQEAYQRLIPPPDPGDPFCQATAGQEFIEDEQGAYWRCAKTRLGLPSVNVIPLQRQDNLARLWPLGPWQSLDRPLERQTELAWLQGSVNVAHQQLLAALRATAASHLPALSSALLRHCLPLWLDDGQAVFTSPHGQLRVILSRELGLVITHVNKETSHERKN